MDALTPGSPAIHIVLHTAGFRAVPILYQDLTGIPLQPRQSCRLETLSDRSSYFIFKPSQPQIPRLGIGSVSLKLRGAGSLHRHDHVPIPVLGFQ